PQPTRDACRARTHRGTIIARPARRSCFFSQADDGIRYFHVTGVQTCALPIYPIRIHDENEGKVQVGSIGLSIMMESDLSGSCRRMWRLFGSTKENCSWHINNTSLVLKA